MTRYSVNTSSPLLYLSGRLDGDPVGGFTHTPEVDFRPLSILATLYGTPAHDDAGSTHSRYLTQTSQRMRVSDGVTASLIKTWNRWTGATTGSVFSTPGDAGGVTPVTTILSSTVKEIRWYQLGVTLTWIDTITLSDLWSMADLDDALLAALATFDWTTIPLAGVAEMSGAAVVNQRMGLLYSAAFNSSGVLVLGATPVPSAFVHPFSGSLLEASMVTFYGSGVLFRVAVWARPLGGHTTYTTTLSATGYDFSIERYTPFADAAGYPYFYGLKTGPLYGDWSSAPLILIAPSYRSWAALGTPPAVAIGAPWSLTGTCLRQCEDAPFLRSIRTNYSPLPTNPLAARLDLDGDAGATIQITGMWLPTSGAAGGMIRLLPVAGGDPVVLTQITYPGFSPRRPGFFLDTNFPVNYFLANGAPRLRDYYPANSSNPIENADGIPWLPAHGYNGPQAVNDSGYATLIWATVAPGSAPAGDYWLEVTTDLGTTSSAAMNPPQAITVL